MKTVKNIFLSTILSLFSFTSSVACTKNYTSLLYTYCKHIICSIYDDPLSSCQDRYPYVKRGDYATLDDSHLKFFKDLLGESHVLTDPSDCVSYNVDWYRTVRGTLVSNTGLALYFLKLTSQ